MNSTLTDSRFARLAPVMLSMLRIVVALIFLEHGTQKLLGFPPPAVARATAELLTLRGFAGALELYGGALLLLGVLTRPVAFLLSGEMAVAYWMSHAPRDLFPVNNGGDSAILYCFAFLYIAVAGPGPWSLDDLFRKRSRKRA